MGAPRAGADAARRCADPLRMCSNLPEWGGAWAGNSGTDGEVLGLCGSTPVALQKILCDRGTQKICERAVIR